LSFIGPRRAEETPQGEGWASQLTVGMSARGLHRKGQRRNKSERAIGILVAEREQEIEQNKKKNGVR
jgi:hypothetical protein